MAKPWVAVCQLAPNPLRAGLCLAISAVALPYSPPAENPCSMRPATITKGAARPIIVTESFRAHWVASLN
jgi:hypothetical protein